MARDEHRPFPKLHRPIQVQSVRAKTEGSPALGSDGQFDTPPANADDGAFSTAEQRRKDRHDQAEIVDRREDTGLVRHMHIGARMDRLMTRRPAAAQIGENDLILEAWPLGVDVTLDDAPQVRTVTPAP